jgi:tRNA (guanine-N7-)-methyltransferase
MTFSKNPLADPVLVTTPYKQGQTLSKGEVRALFAHPNRPLHVDLGTGKGRFLTQSARKHPKTNWIGIEKKPEHLFQALRQRKITPYSNLRYIWMDIAQLPQIFTPGQVNRFYLNFSTPWEEKVHVKKRLTHPRFLKIYHDLLSNHGDLIFKTDHTGFYDFSMEAFAESGWEVLEQTDDFLHSEWHDPDVMSEWEEISIDMGYNIFYARVVPPR